MDLAALAVSLYGQFVDLFNSRDVSAISGLLGILGIGGIGSGLFQLVKFAKKRKPTRVVTIERTHRVRVEFDGDEAIEVDQIAALLFDNPGARRSLAKVTAPLSNEGIEEIEFLRGGVQTFKAEKADAESFDVPSDIGDELVSESDRIVRIVSPSFKDGNKWRVHDGSQTIYAAILMRLHPSR